MIAGSVVDAQGRPVAGARVFFTETPVPMPEIAAVTDVDGRFVLAASAPGTYTVAGAADDASASARVTLPADDGDVTLRLAPG